MLFKSSTILYTTLAFAVAAPYVTTASPLTFADPTKRGAATCNLNVTVTTFPRDDPPPLPTGNPLQSEWAFLAGRFFLESVPQGTPLTVSRPTIQGPLTLPSPGQGTYAIVQTITTDAVTDAEAAGIISGWVGREVVGSITDAEWRVDGVECAQ